jgi:hypothetical protein
MKRAVAGLVGKGMIEKTGQANGYGKEQGVEYRVLNMDWQPTLSRQANTSSQPSVAPIKEKLLKENIKGKSAPPDTKSCPDWLCPKSPSCPKSIASARKVGLVICCACTSNFATKGPSKQDTSRLTGRLAKSLRASTRARGAVSGEGQADASLRALLDADSRRPFAGEFARPARLRHEVLVPAI